MKRLLPILLIGGGAAVSAAAWWGFKKSSDMEDDLSKAIGGETTLTSGAKYPTFNARLTGYWPFSARPDERTMEGGKFDRKMPEGYKNKPDSPQYKKHVLHTVEDYLAGKSDFVSLSGDDQVWPYGQKVLIPWNGKMIVGRVVDTGSHFRGTTKVYRAMGSEPLDICVDSSATKVPKLLTAQIVPGDNFESGKAVATAGFKGQTVVVGGYSIRDIVENAVEAAPIRRSRRKV